MDSSLYYILLRVSINIFGKLSHKKLGNSVDVLITTAGKCDMLISSKISDSYDWCVSWHHFWQQSIVKYVTE